MNNQVAFEAEVRKEVDAQREQVLSEVGRIARDGAQDIVRRLTGARYDRWDHVWTFEDVDRRRMSPEMNAIVSEKAVDLSKALIEKVLDEPIVFTPKDMARLRAVMKEAVIETTGRYLAEKAEAIARELVDGITSETAAA